MTQKQYYKEPIATFNSNKYLLAFNIVYRIILCLLIGMIVYLLLSLPFKFELDPIAFFIKFLPYCLGFSLLIAMAWTLYFHRTTVNAYKDKMIIDKAGKEIEIDYSDIISFNLEKNYLIIIPLPTDKTIVSVGSSKFNRLTKLSTLSNEDFINLLEICNSSRKADQEIPLRKSRTFFS